MINKITRSVMLFGMGMLIYDSKMSFMNSVVMSALILGYGFMSYNDGLVQ